MFLYCAFTEIILTRMFSSGFVRVGGYDALWSKYESAVGTPYRADGGNSSLLNATHNSTLEACYKMTPYWGNMIRPLDDPDYPWLGIWTTLPIMGVWYWCTDQVSL